MQLEAVLQQDGMGKYTRVRMTCHKLLSLCRHAQAVDKSSPAGLYCGCEVCCAWAQALQLASSVEPAPPHAGPGRKGKQRAKARPARSRGACLPPRCKGSSVHIQDVALFIYSIYRVY